MTVKFWKTVSKEQWKFCFIKAFLFAFLIVWGLQTLTPVSPFLLLLTRGSCTHHLGISTTQLSILSYNAESPIILTKQLYPGTKIFLLVHCLLLKKQQLHYHPSVAHSYYLWVFSLLAEAITDIYIFQGYLGKSTIRKYCYKIWGYSFYQMLTKPNNFAYNNLTML